MSDLHAKIERLLAEKRPDRYEREGGTDWLDDVAAEISADIPDWQARTLAASQMVRQREGVLTKRTNELVRQIAKTGQWPLDWFELHHFPLAVDKERVAIRAVTARDLEVFAVDERRRAASDFATRNETCEAAEWLAKEMESTGASTLGELDLPEADVA